MEKAICLSVLLQSKLKRLFVSTRGLFYCHMCKVKYLSFLHYDSCFLKLKLHRRLALMVTNKSVDQKKIDYRRTGSVGERRKTDVIFKKSFFWNRLP